MKNFIILLFLVSNVSVYSQYGLKINKTDYFTVSGTIEPYSSFKEKGLNYILEIEYAGFMYTKIGIERFAVLTGGYQDLHVGLGINFNSGLEEDWRYYVGIRPAMVWRTNTGGYVANRINLGLEAGIDYEFTENWTIGARLTLDKRYDQEIFGWKPETKPSCGIRFGHKWNYKPKHVIN